MTEPKCPVCGGEVDPQRLADTHRREGPKGVVVIETSFNPEPVKAHAKAMIEEVLEVRSALEVLDEGARLLRLLIIMVFAYGLGTLIGGNWAIGGISVLYGCLAALAVRRIRSMTKAASSRFDENVNLAGLASEADAENASLN